jgi:hypothetical protein
LANNGGGREGGRVEVVRVRLKLDSIRSEPGWTVEGVSLRF